MKSKVIGGRLVDLSMQENDFTACYPWMLQQAIGDSFACMLELVTGTQIYFEEAKPINAHWVHLANIAMVHAGHTWPSSLEDKLRDEAAEGVTCPRGIDVRIDHITWVAKAPFGS